MYTFLFFILYIAYFFCKYDDLQSWSGNLFSLMFNPVFPTGEQKLFLELLLLAYSYATLCYISYPPK